MSKSDSSKSSKGTSGAAAKGGTRSDTGEWAKAVVDGMPDTTGSSAPPPAPLGNVVPDANVTPDEILDAVDAAAMADADPADADPAEVVADDEASEPVEVVEEADIQPDFDAEIVDAEVVETEIADAPDTETETEVGDVGAAVRNDGEPISVEDLVIDLERVTTERDQYLDASRRLQAEFENYKKQVAKRESQARERANDSLIADLLPVMDAFDGAIANGAEDVGPMRSSFLDALSKQGLERIDPGEDPFDPNLHEAVMHEDDAEVDGPVVAEVMRAGYVWKGRVLRPAMVRTRG